MFHKKVDFSGATFDDNVTFKGITFNEEAIFENVNFKATGSGYVSFKNTTFKQLANFKEAKFHEKQDTIFDDATFEGAIEFKEACFNEDVSFKNTTFKGIIDFSEVDFKKKLNFFKAKFDKLPKFTGGYAKDKQWINLTETQFLFQDSLGGLSSEEAQNTWHIFYKALQDEQNYEKFVECFAGYNNAQIKGNSLSQGRKIILWLYGFFSLYGYSISKPIIFLLISVFVFSITYSWIIFGINLENKPFYDINSYIPNKYSLYLSAQNMFPFITDNVVLLDKVFNPENGTKSDVLDLNINGFRADASYMESIKTSKETFLQMAGLTIENLSEEKQKYLWLLFPVRILQFLFSTLCLFLFGLGVRNFLRLK